MLIETLVVCKRWRNYFPILVSGSSQGPLPFKHSFLDCLYFTSDHPIRVTLPSSPSVNRLPRKGLVGPLIQSAVLVVRGVYCSVIYVRS